MKIPKLFHLQVAVLAIVVEDELSGEDIRQKTGLKIGPGFYQLMARLEREKLVSGRYIKTVTRGQPVRKKVYRLTEVGRREMKTVEKFYRSVFPSER